MNIGVTTWNPVLKLAVWTGWFPSAMLTGYWGMMSSRALITAVELGVFDQLEAAPRSAEQLAEALGTDPVGTEALLNALNGFGFLKRRGGQYRVTRSTRRWLSRGQRLSVGGAFGLFHVLWDEMSDMEDRLRAAQPRDFHAGRDTEFWSRYQTGLAQFARLTSSEIVRKVPLPDQPLRMLDVGGGHATYTARFCNRYPSLSADVIDLPGATAIGRELVDSTGLAERIRFREADLSEAEWGTNYDLVLLFNIVHIFEPHEVRRLFERARAALRPGGTVAVLDSAHRGGDGDLDAVGGVNELLFWVINGTRAYPESDMVSWMEQAGFERVRSRHLVTIPQSALTTGRA